MRCWLPNAGFDATLLQYEAELANIDIRRLRFVDTVPWARAMELPSLKLQQLVDHFHWQHGDAHRALPDALATVDLWRHAREKLSLKEMRRLTPPQPLPRRWWRASKLPPEILHIDRLISEGGTIRFRYTDARGESSERTIRPWGYAMTKQGLRFHGYCLLRHGRRRFAAERCEFLA